jgi:hypothetical protein
MEMAFFVIAVIGLLAISSSGSSPLKATAPVPVATGAPSTGVAVATPGAPAATSAGAATWTPTPVSPINAGIPPELTATGVLGNTSGLHLYNLIGPAVVAPSGGTAASALLGAQAGASQGMKVGGPIGAGIGAVAGAIASIWAAHAARAAGAKSENQALNSACIAFDASLKNIFGAANARQINATEAITLLQGTLAYYWQGMAKYMVGPGRNDGSAGGTKCTSVVVCNQQSPPGLTCNSSCTAGCCVGCDVFTPTINQAINIFQQVSGGTLTVCPVYGNTKYGANSRASYTLTYSPG